MKYKAYLKELRILDWVGEEKGIGPRRSFITLGLIASEAEVQELCNLWRARGFVEYGEEEGNQFTLTLQGPLPSQS